MARTIMARTNTLSKDAAQVLEEKLEFSNVTDLRQNLLPAIERIEKNPALRYLILKRGRPQAVLMSTRTYDLVKKIMNQIASTQAAVPREEAIESAFERLRAERGSAGRADSTAAAVEAATNTTATEGLNQQEVMHQMVSMLQELMTEMKELRRGEASKAGVASVSNHML
jgi:PHD/YefM family antitoxin component YafN of YafNO toxin-antitoxin module